MSRSEAISGNGYDAEDVDREIAADNARADAMGLVFDSDARHDQAPASPTTEAQDVPSIDEPNADPADLAGGLTYNQDPQP
jgi:capsid protein